MSVVLQEPIKEGYGVVIPDNIYVGGNTYRQMIKNWEQVLALLLKNNLKLSPKKTLFPSKN